MVAIVKAAKVVLCQDFSETHFYVLALLSLANSVDYICPAQNI